MVMSKSEGIQIAETIRSQIHSMILDCAGAHDFTAQSQDKKYRGGLGFKIQNTSKYENATVIILLTWADDYTIKLYNSINELIDKKEYEYNELIDKKERVYADELSDLLETMWETKETKKVWDKNKRFEMKVITQ
jgi:hypothetical protein